MYRKSDDPSNYLISTYLLYETYIYEFPFPDLTFVHFTNRFVDIKLELHEKA